MKNTCKKPLISLELYIYIYHNIRTSLNVKPPEFILSIIIAKIQLRKTNITYNLYKRLKFV